MRILQAAHGAFADPDCTVRAFDELDEVLPLDGEHAGAAPFGDCPLVRVDLPDGSTLWIPATRTTD